MIDCVCLRYTIIVKYSSLCKNSVVIITIIRYKCRKYYPCIYFKTLVLKYILLLKDNIFFIGILMIEECPIKVYASTIYNLKFDMFGYVVRFSQD